VSGLTVALTGDTILQRRVAACADEDFLDAVRVVRSADVGMTNLEGCVQSGEDWHSFVAGNGRGATYIRTPTNVGDDLDWMGLQLLSLANNHAADFGERGFLTTREHLARWPTLRLAGSGATLAEATAPTYLETAAGVVAFVAAADWGPRGLGDLTFPAPLGAMAADADRYFRGRPGMNLLRFDCEFTVSPQALDSLRDISTQMGWEIAKQMRTGGGGRAEPMTGASPGSVEADADGSFYFMGRKFIKGAEHSFRTVAYAGDVDRIVKSVIEARRHADWVIASFHQHGAARSSEEAPDHTVTLGRAVLEAGADVFVAHGAGRVGGIEFVGSGVGVYGQGTWIQHLDQIKQQPLEMLARFGLGYEDDAGRLLEVRAERETKSRMAIDEDPSRTHHVGRMSSITMVNLEAGEAPTVSVFPLESRTKQAARSLTGMPKLLRTDSKEGSAVLDVVRRRSEIFGTDVQSDGSANRAVKKSAVH
jgi:poly-gamma-glutamate capsule biosynthesis protein CapA/YwtB (metallophosphatase superfamily)